MTDSAYRAGAVNTTQRMLQLTQSRQNKLAQQLVSGFQNGNAGDNPASVSINSTLTAQLRGIHKAQQNVSFGSSVVNIADGATQSVTSDLQRIRELTVQASNGTNSAASNQAIAEEISQLSQNIDQTVQSTQFNGNTLIDGSANITIQTGDNQTQTIAPGNASTDAAGGGLGLFDSSGGSATFTDAADLAANLSSGNAQSFLADVDRALQQANNIQSNLGASEAQLNSTLETLSVQGENTASALSTSQDTDIAAVITEISQNSILQMVQVAVEAQTSKMTTASLSLLTP